MNKKLFLIILIFSNFSVVAQTEIIGKIIVKGVSAEGVHVINLVTEKAAVSDAKGEFRMTVSEDDLLVFSAVHLLYTRKSISANEIKAGRVEVKMEEKVNQLDEVVVSDKADVDAKSLGIINYTPKKLTPAERKLYTATSGSGIVPLDPIINWISGRTKMLKKEIEVEKRERFLKRINAYYDDAFFIENLKIPELYVEGFKYYVVEDENLTQALQAKNKIKCTFLLGELAQDFLTYINEHEK